MYIWCDRDEKRITLTKSLHRLAGSASHMGGSCQISLSFDGGNTWIVIKSIIGGCANPDPSGSQEFGFKIPNNVQNGDALLAWYTIFLTHRLSYNSFAK